VAVDVRHPQRPSEVLLRKGRPLTTLDLERLSSIGRGPMVVLLPDGDLDENVAAARVAAALAGPHVEISAPHQGMAMLRSARRGFFRVDATSLAMVNAHAGVLALSAADERAVDVGAALAAVKVAPLLCLSRSSSVSRPPAQRALP
jgi:molybdenum cofactor cytidylyltransferase